MRATSDNNQPFDVEVEQVDQATAPDGGLRLVIVARVTNPGTLPTGTSAFMRSSLQVVDERGRQFPEARSERGVLPDVLAREYGAKLASSSLEPGLSAKQVWAFVVAPDVQRLTLSVSRR